MIERKRAQAGSDGVCWSCPRCKTTKSIRHGSFFSKSKLSLQQWMIGLLWWAKEYPVTAFAEEAEISGHAAVDIYQWLREVCTNKLLQSPIVLGGPGVVVQIDESQFRHKPKVKLMINNNYLKVNSLPKPLGSMLCRKYLLLQKINKHNNINHI